MANHYEESKRKDLERVIRTQITILNRHELTREKRDELNNYVIDLQNYYYRKYDKYYVLPKRY